MAFLTYVKTEDGSMPLLDRIAVVTLYSIVLTFVGASFYNIPFLLDGRKFYSAGLMVVFVMLCVVGLAVFWKTRSVSAARIPFGFLVLILIFQQIIEGGGIYGLGVLYFLLGFPVVYLFFGVKIGIFLMISYFVGISASLLAGNYNPDSSIYNNRSVIDRMLFILALGTFLNVVVSLCLEMLLRHLARLAYYDTVSGLPNRQKMEDHIRQYIVYDTGHSRPIAALGIKVLDYNRVNALLGTVQGDALLAEMGKRLKECGAESLINGRWSGSLFISVVCESEYRSIVFRTNRILDRLSQPYALADRTHSLLFSVAVSRYPQDALTGEQLFGNVISLLDRSQHHPGEIIFFNEENLKTQQFHFNLIEDMNRMDPDRDLRLVYQPKGRMSDSSCTGAEILLRWTEASRGPISPGVFIPLAERTGLIRKITRWVIRRCLDDLCEEPGRSLIEASGAIHSINLSVIDLKEREFVFFLEAELAKRSCSTKHIEFEITEGVIIDDDPQIRKNLDALLALGFRIAIDDFGTGYSSLSYLNKFRMHTLKIDQSFIRDIGSRTERESQPVVDAIISMSKALGLEIVAEGVETEVQAAYLRERGCDIVQGWLYSRDLPLDEYLRFLENHPIREL